MVGIGLTYSESDNNQFDKSLMDSKLWTKEFTWTRDGFCYTLNSTLLVGTSFEKDSIVIVGNNVSMHQVVYIHDPDFFIINDKH